MSVKQFVSEHVTGLTATGDSVSIATVVATLSDNLPEVAALFSLIWSVIRIGESRAVRRLVSRLRGRGSRD